MIDEGQLEGPTTPGLRRDQIRRVETLYSNGSVLSEIREAFAVLPDWFSRELRLSPTQVDDPATLGSTFDSYLSVVSLVVLFGDVEGARLLADATIRNGVEDFFVDSFLGSLVEFREPTQSLQLETISNFHGVSPINRTHEPLKQAVELRATDREAAAKAVTTYVSKEWYPLNKWTGWHNKHKATRGSEKYSGYWCFVGAAAAKVFGIDDSQLETSKYYPWDLAHVDIGR